MAQDDRTKSILKNIAPSSDASGLRPFGRVRVSLARSLQDNPQAQLAFTFAVNLLARLSPVIGHLEVLVPKGATVCCQLPKWREATLNAHLKTLLTSLNPPVQWSISDKISQEVEIQLCIGSSPSRIDTVYIGTDGWEATVSPQESLSVGERVNPVGAYASACLGVAEIFKRLLKKHIPTIRVPVIPLETTLQFSTLTYRVGNCQPNPPIPDNLDIDRLTVVGVGAGGGATVFTLASFLGLVGHLNFIEPDETTETNLNRYVFADLDDVGSQKTSIAEALFNPEPLTIRTFPKPFDEAYKELSGEDLRSVVSAVHSREARREIQYETPLVLWDAGATEDGEFRVWRMILGKNECMLCKHPANHKDPERRTAAQLDERFGLGADTWFRKLKNNEPFDNDEVRSISSQLEDQEMEFDCPEVGQRVSDWYTDQCGRLHLPELKEEVPIPFAPVMAGVLLAGEVIKEQHFPSFVLKGCYFNTLVGNFMYHQKPFLRSPKNNCEFCADPLLREQYDRRWS